ncbi:nutritional copper sensing transcription factor Cuf1 [Schizosaccharomyces japonicus yFS275]|uniref:Nutritional copper sensing transcription factor Cuf1 n=1 Tax=Schizosaccharomyces japonicus (strain yFS275 / FY16936) TaxID=402676 RepID=B6JWM4_SCHJY|nr:nutritional copper sensing transcription factor Cuf1 [Schizosaccharomyces japonicus yFS275]EEB05775.1 nutritional copper sensing transcription factor Cuf1 [Schizosaccharomyces japonicus yFS275]
MVIRDNHKMACMKCIRGHRASGCNHTDRELFVVRPKGRPITQCESCRRARKTRRLHIKCNCASRDKDVQQARQQLDQQVKQVFVETHKRNAPAAPYSSCCRSNAGHMNNAPCHSDAPAAVRLPSIVTPDAASPANTLPYVSVLRPPTTQAYMPPLTEEGVVVPGHLLPPGAPKLQPPATILPSHEPPAVLPSQLVHSASPSDGYGAIPNGGAQHTEVYPFITNSEAAITAAAAAHNFYPQPAQPLSFALLGNGEYLPVVALPNQAPNTYAGVGHVPEQPIPAVSVLDKIQLADHLEEFPRCAKPSSQCSCGENCQCVGCLTHPNNATTLAALNHISVLHMENAVPPKVPTPQPSQASPLHYPQPSQQQPQHYPVPPLTSVGSLLDESSSRKAFPQVGEAKKAQPDNFLHVALVPQTQTTPQTCSSNAPKQLFPAPTGRMSSHFYELPPPFPSHAAPGSIAW